MRRTRSCGLSACTSERFSSTPLESERGGRRVWTTPGASWTFSALQQPVPRLRRPITTALLYGFTLLRFVTQDIGAVLATRSARTLIYSPAACSPYLLWSRGWSWRTDQHHTNRTGTSVLFLDAPTAGEAGGRCPPSRCGRSTTPCLPALRAARLHHLGAGDAGPVPLAARSRRLQAGLHEQVAGFSLTVCYSRQQQLWFTERVIDIVGQELGIDPVEHPRSRRSRTRMAVRAVSVGHLVRPVMYDFAPLRILDRVDPELLPDDVDHALGEPQLLLPRVAAVWANRRLVRADLLEVDANVPPAVQAGVTCAQMMQPSGS